MSGKDPDFADGANGEPRLARALGRNMAIALVVGNVIGTGIFLKPGNIAANCGSFGLIIAVWILGGVLCVLGGMCLAELATMLPHAGGPYVYIRAAYGRMMAFLFGWTELLIVRPASIAALSVAMIGSLALALQIKVSPLVQLMLACGLVAGMAWVNIVGVIWGGRVQLATTIFKAGFLALLVLAPILLAPLAGWTLRLENYAPAPLPDPMPLGAQIGAVLLAVMWAYDGWHGVTPLAEEIRDPHRNIPLALIGGIGTLIVLYVALNIAYHGVLSLQEMRAAGEHVSEEMLRKVAGPAGQTAMSLMIVCSAFGAINSNLMMAPRVTYAMSRDGVLFRAFSLVHSQYRTPVVAILASAVMGIALMAAVAIGKYAAAGVVTARIQWRLGREIVASLQTNSTFTLLTNFVIFSTSVFLMLAVLALIVLRFRLPDLKRPSRTWAYPYVPLVFLGVYAWFLAQVYRDSPLESRTGLAFILAGIPVYFLTRRPVGSSG